MTSNRAPRRRSKESTRVAILIETSTQWGREIILGIKHYVERNQRWHIFIEPRGANEIITPPENWHGKGIIADIHNEGTAKALKQVKIPVVNISDAGLPGVKFPRVCVDIAATSETAARYYFERGYKNFAYLRLAGNGGDEQKCDSFRQAVKRYGGNLLIYDVNPRAHGVPDWNLSLPKIANWLRSLPKPVGILSWGVGHEVIEACRIADLVMPNDVALLMFSYDEIFLEMPEIPLSGVVQSTRKIGYEAAALLSRLMNGGKATKDIEIPPLGVNTRMSSEVLAVPDPVLTKALKYIYANADKPFGVGDIASHTGTSRRILERRFMEVCHRTPADYIRLIHLERAKELLRNTTLPIPDVSERSGFTSPDYMGFYFKKSTGQTPLQYRKQMSFTTRSGRTHDIH